MQPFNLVFWAILFVLAGIVLLLKQFTHLAFNPFPVILALFLILLGISFITRSSQSYGFYVHQDAHNNTFSEQDASMDATGDYNCVFGKSDLDLTQAAPGSVIEVNCVFGQINAKLPKDKAIKLEASSAFGQIESPDMGSVSFGTNSISYDGEGDPIVVKANCVFGSIDFKQ